MRYVEPARDGSGEQQASRAGSCRGVMEPARDSPDAADMAKKAGRKAASTGREVASSRWMRGLARAGLLARGVNYLLVGSLAAQIALGSRGTQADTTSALRAVARHPGGIVVLWLLAAGFAGLALWRFTPTSVQ